MGGGPPPAYDLKEQKRRKASEMRKMITGTTLISAASERVFINVASVNWKNTQVELWSEEECCTF